MNMREGALLAYWQFAINSICNTALEATHQLFNHANTTYSRHLFCMYSTWLHVFLIASLAQSSLHIGSICWMIIDDPSCTQRKYIQHVTYEWWDCDTVISFPSDCTVPFPTGCNFMSIGSSLPCNVLTQMPSSLHGPLKHWQTPAMVDREWHPMGPFDERCTKFIRIKYIQISNYRSIIISFTCWLRKDRHPFLRYKCCWPWRKLRRISTYFVGSEISPTTWQRFLAFYIYTKLRILQTLNLKLFQSLWFPCLLSWPTRWILHIASFLDLLCSPGLLSCVGISDVRYEEIHTCLCYINTLAHILHIKIHLITPVMPRAQKHDYACIYTHDFMSFHNYNIVCCR